eukprot:scaffold2862_cov272-Pinguiococcus_pyrenoidosus.AAC.4
MPKDASSAHSRPGVGGWPCRSPTVQEKAAMTALEDLHRAVLDLNHEAHEQRVQKQDKEFAKRNGDVGHAH